MNDRVTSARPGHKRALSQWSSALVVLVVAVACVFPALAAAQGPVGTLTQGEYLRWMVKAGAPKGSVPVTATTADDMNWAVAHGIQPTGGWQPSARLTREAYVQTLAQLYHMPPTVEPTRALAIHGVTIPFTREVARSTISQVFNDYGFQSQTARYSRDPATPVNPGDKVAICHIPPGNPRNAQTMIVAQSAVHAHLAHGDYLGACIPQYASGGDDRGDKGAKDDKSGKDDKGSSGRKGGN